MTPHLSAPQSSAHRIGAFRSDRLPEIKIYPKLPQDMGDLWFYWVGFVQPQKMGIIWMLRKKMNIFGPKMGLGGRPDAPRATGSTHKPCHFGVESKIWMIDVKSTAISEEQQIIRNIIRNEQYFFPRFIGNGTIFCILDILHFIVWIVKDLGQWDPRSVHLQNAKANNRKQD